MQSAETVLGVLRERGRRGLPVNELYRQLFNPELYFLAYGNIYSNKGAMTPGPDGETADGMSRGKIGRVLHSRGAGNWCQRSAGSGGSQGFPSITARTALSAPVPCAAAVSR